MKLVIVESPTKAKTLGRFLGKDFQIMASMGHLRDLPKGKLGVDVEHNFEPTYVLDPKKTEIIEGLKTAALKAGKVILATDPDREGEAIAYHIAYILKKNKVDDTRRIVFHEITKSAVEEALKHPGKLNHKLIKAQTARRVLDRLVGYKLSPLLWRKVRRGLSAGRVQSPAVRLIVEREREIKAFKPEEFWLITVNLKSKNGEAFSAKLEKYKDKLIEIKSKAQVSEIIKNLDKADFEVVKIETKQLSSSPPPPFITSTLQRTASSIFHWSAKKTMREAQRLYEQGRITYHRTDSVNLAQEALIKARAYIAQTFGKDYLPSKPRFYKTKSHLAQEAHEAIRPTKINSKLKTQNSKLKGDGEKLYQLIFNRFVACQMKEQILQRNIVDIKAADYLLRAIGETEKFKGWRVIYKREHLQLKLPLMIEGEKLKLVKILPEQKFTAPPARYTEGSLIKALEDRGIGRPSTYAPIISTIKARQYVIKELGVFIPTAVGETVNDFLVKYFENVVDDDFTAQMEDNLDKIAQGEKEWIPIIKTFYSPFSKKVVQVEKKAKREKIAVESTGKKCPDCKKGMQVIRTGRFGKFLSCSTFPKCRWKAVYIEKLKGVKCPKCKGEIVIRKTRKGRQFYGCANWPKCQWASWQRPQPPASAKT